MLDTDEEGWTVLHCAADEGHVDIVDFLLANGVEQSRTNDGSTPIIVAATTGQAEVLPLLARNGNIHDVDNRGRTAIHVACKEQRLDAVMMLLEFGADPRRSNNVCGFAMYSNMTGR